MLVGVGPEAASLAVLVTGIAEFIYHWNVPTPYWLGFLIQRPESHGIHHQEGVHSYNYADLDRPTPTGSPYEAIRCSGAAPGRGQDCLRRPIRQNVREREVAKMQVKSLTPISSLGLPEPSSDEMLRSLGNTQ